MSIESRLPIGQGLEYSKYVFPSAGWLADKAETDEWPALAYCAISFMADGLSSMNQSAIFTLQYILSCISFTLVISYQYIRVPLHQHKHIFTFCMKRAYIQVPTWKKDPRSIELSSMHCGPEENC